MTKLLCLLIILANLSLLLWEYRSGGFADKEQPTEVQEVSGKEQIILLGEIKAQPQLQPSIPDQNIPSTNPDVGQ